MDKKNIIVFGAYGNLGLYFIDYLINNLDFDEYNVIATGINEECPYDFGDKISYYKVDITNKNDFEKLPKKVYSIIDFAGILPAYNKNIDNEEYFNVNTIGTLNILEYARKTNTDRIAYTQTWADLNGYLKDNKPLKPYVPRKPIMVGDHAIYCISKSAAVDLIEHYHEQYGIKNYIFRLPNIYLYSPEIYYYVDGEKKYISYRYLIERAIKGEPIELWGDPNKGKDIIYVKDLCQMIYKSMFTEKESGVYNAGTGVKTTMQEQIEGIIEVFSSKEKRSKIIYCPNKKDCDDFVMDISNIIDDLGYEPEYNYIKYLEDYKKERELNRFEKMLKK